MDLESRLFAEAVAFETRKNNIARVSRLIVAKSTIPGLKGFGKKRVATTTVVERAKRAPVEDQSGRTAPSENAKVSLHGYLKLEKGQRLTSEDLAKAERKATREGNQAILDRINSVRRFVEKKKGVNKDSETGKRVTRGYAVYRGIKTSPKAAGYKSQRALAVGFGQLEYYYVPGDKRFSLDSIDRRLSAAFKSNPSEAAVLVNKLAREKKILILMRWDTANKRVHVPANAVTAGVSAWYSDRELTLKDVRAFISMDDNNGYCFTLCGYSNDDSILTLTGDHASEAVASGMISLSDVKRCLFVLAIRMGAIRERLITDEAKDVEPCANGANDAKTCSTPPVPTQVCKTNSTLAPVAASVSLPTLAPKQHGPKSMRKLRGAPIVRLIETSDKRLELFPSDWALVISVCGQKIREAIICNGDWSVARDNVNDVIIFKDIRRFGNPIAVDTSFLMHKLV